MPDRPRRSRPARKRPVERPPAPPTSLPDGHSVSDELSPAPPSRNGHGGQSTGLSGWAVLGAGIVALGFGLRFLSLGGQPLGPREAANALDSLAIYRGQGGAASAGPLLVYGQAIVFALFGASDATARLLSAALGTAVVAIPLYLERELGRLGARFAAFLLAISPTLVYLSRQTEAAMPVAALAFAAIVLYHVAVRDSSPRALFACVVALALLVTAGPLAYYALVTFAAYLLLRGVFGRTAAPEPATRVGFVGPAGPRVAGAPLLPPTLRASIRPAHLLLAFAAVWLIATTGVLGNLNGIQQGLVDGLAGWFASLVDASGRSPLYYLAALASYEQAPLLFGALGLVALRRDAFAGKLTFWALAVLVLGSIAQSRPIGLAAQVTIPLAVLGGAYADRLIRTLAAPDGRRGLLAFSLGSTVILGGLGIALSVFSLPNPPVTTALLAVPILVAAAALAYSVMANGVARTMRHLLVVALAIAVLWGWRENSMLSYGAGANPAQMLVDAATSPDARQLATDVGDISDAFAIDGRQPGVLLSPALPPMVQWYLRDNPYVTVGQTPQGNTLVMVVPLDTDPPAGYVGQRYRLGTTDVLKIGSWGAFWRWYAYREAPDAGQSSDAMVYVRPIG